MRGHFYRRLFSFFLVVAALMPTSAYASPLRYIELTDGSIVRGEVVGAGNGVYRIRTQSLGIVELKESDIRNIGSMPSDGASRRVGNSGGDAMGREAATIQRRILDDPALLNSISALKDDPAVLSIMHDPEVMRAIQSGDLNALQNNRKIEQLIESPSVRGVLNELTK